MDAADDVFNTHAQPFFVDRSHDYSDPDEPDVEIIKSGSYDHLSPTEVDVHPEGSAHTFEDLEGLTEEIAPPTPKDDYSRGYVPTQVNVMWFLYSRLQQACQVEIG